MQEETGSNANFVRSGIIHIMLVSKPTLTSSLLFEPALIVKTNKLFALYSYNYRVRKCSYNGLSTIVSCMEKVYIKWTINYLS